MEGARPDLAKLSAGSSYICRVSKLQGKRESGVSAAAGGEEEALLDFYLPQR